MKYLAFIFLALCPGADALMAQQATVSGTVTSLEKAFMLFRYRDQLDTLWVNEQGAFSTTLRLDRGEECRILNGKQLFKLYVLPGDQLSVSFDAANPKDAGIYAGKSAAACNYYQAAARADAGLNKHVHIKVLGPRSPAQVMKTLDSVRVVREQTLAGYVSANQLDEQFLAYMKEVVGYQCLLEGAVYRKNSDTYRNEAFAGERAALDGYLRSMPLDNPRVLYSETYQGYVRTMLAGDVLGTMQVESADDLPAFYLTQMKLATEQLKNQEVRNYMLKETMVEAMKESGTRDITACMAWLDKYNNNEPMKERVRKIWRQYAAIQPGMPCPPIEQYNASGEVYGIDHFKGKVVYIDVWATWCGPCKKEIPHLKTLEEKYHGKNIEFVSVSTDQDIEKWKTFIATENMTGTQLHQSDDAERTISRHFVVNAIPRFILIDEAGKIVSADAPRPSSGDVLYGLIDTVLND